MAKLQTQLNIIIKFVGIYLVSLSLASASGTYVPPATSYEPPPSYTPASSVNAPVQRAFRAPNAPSVRKNYRRTRNNMKVGLNNDNNYNVGKEYIFKEIKNNQTPGCSSCHTGAASFDRTSLLAKKDRLAEIIQDCNGPHSVYCKEGKSSLTSRVETIVHTLKVRFNLGK